MAVKQKRLALGAAYFFGRLMLLLALPLEGVQGYGDSIHFFRMAVLPGWPYLHYWSEFPPVFPFVSALLARLAAGSEHTHLYLLVLMLTLADLANLLVFEALARRLDGANEQRSLLYALGLVSLAYGWWYFDPLAVLPLLLGLLWLLQGRELRAGLVWGLGILVKLFPALALAAAWRRLPPRRALRVTAAALGLAALVYAGLWLASPDFTLASLRSQSAKGSWETVWALVDGNFRTGNFGAETERLNPATAALARGNPARISPWLTLPVFGLLGLLALRKSQAHTSDRALIGLVGLAFCLFWLWSPGWSPQWVLYLLPLILLAFPLRMAGLLALTLTLVNLMEWPLLLSRGMFWALWLTIPLRTLLLVLLAWLFYQTALNKPLDAGRQKQE